MFDIAIKLFLFLSPLFCFRDFQHSMVRGRFFIFSTIVIFAVSFFVEQKRKLYEPLIGVFLLLGFINVFFNNGAMPNEWLKFLLSSEAFMYIFCGVILFYSVYCYADKVESYITPIVIVCSLNFVLAVCQYLHYDFMWNKALGMNGFMETPSQLGQYSALSLPLLYYINPFLSIIPFCTLILSKSVTPFIALFCGMSFLFIRLKKYKLQIIMTILVAILFTTNFNYISAKWQCRPERWQKTLQFALKKPFLGWGYQTYNQKVMELTEKHSIGKIEYQRPHNDYLHTAQELGFPIVVCFVMFFTKLFRKLKSIDKLTLYLSASLIIMLVNMLAQTFIRYASIASVFIVLSALLFIKIEGSYA